MIARNLSLLAVLLVLVLMHGSATAQSTQPVIVQPLLIAAGVLLDPQEKVAYLMNESDHVSAIDLETGNDLWTLPVSADPLIADENKLVLLIRVKGTRNQIHLRWVDTAAQGKTILDSDIIQLPDWADTGMVNGRSFSTQTLLEGRTLLLRWKADAYYAHGAAPTAEMMKAEERSAAGVAAIDTRSGKVEMHSADRMTSVPRTQLPRELTASAPTSAKSVRWIEPPVQMLDAVAAVSVEENLGGDSKLVLHHWNTTERRSVRTMDLWTGRKPTAAVLARSRHVVVRPQEAKPPAEDNPWALFSLDTGDLQATIPAEHSLLTSTIVGTRALNVIGQTTRYNSSPPYMYSPRELKAVDLKTGKLLWHRPIASSKSPLPPA